MCAFANHGGVSVLQTDPGTGATLMPHLRPGTDLAKSNLEEAECISIAVNLYRQLQAAPLVEAWTHERWFRELWDGAPTDLSRVRPELLDFGQRLGRYLLETTTRKTLLHGDLHHYNILRNGNDWVVIDPKGLLGDPAFEPVAFLRNPVDSLKLDENLEERQRFRIQRFAELLDEPIERIWGWAITQMVLDAVWSGSDWGITWASVAEATLAVRPPEAKKLPSL
jgi:streptomycin 6-kinase